MDMDINQVSNQVSGITAISPKKNPSAAMIWSILCAGFGQFYNGDTAQGVAFFIATVLCWVIFWPIWIIVVIVSVDHAYRRANEINEQIAGMLAEKRSKENEEDAINATHTKVADLVIKVEKIYALNKSGLLSEEEYRSKVSYLISELSEKKPFESAEDFLTALIPLAGSGALNADDLSRIKATL
ncbi:TM2 domain-containing protein [Glaciimonas soli]|uniref:TM2 domain-containing protein n=1 Tax=Glaciimonas soli TaxID=2590999 RepID=A0A843YSI7_9BURK|nr:TM2 domain-containing protein [Glaciimonas soli]MQR00957.1 hypothetical protein [Glaciimonas soli]